MLVAAAAKRAADQKAAADRAAQGLPPLTMQERAAQVAAQQKAAQLAAFAASTKAQAAVKEAAVKPADADVIGSVLYSSPTGKITPRSETLTKSALLAATATINAMAPTAKYPWWSSFRFPFAGTPSIHESDNGSPAIPRAGVRWNGGDEMSNPVTAKIKAITLERNAIKYIDADPATAPDRLKIAGLYAGALFQLRDYVLENQLP
jgi:hypothetical protein